MPELHRRAHARRAAAPSAKSRRASSRSIVGGSWRRNGPARSPSRSHPPLDDLRPALGCVEPLGVGEGARRLDRHLEPGRKPVVPPGERGVLRPPVVAGVELDGLQPLRVELQPASPRHARRVERPRPAVVRPPRRAHEDRHPGILLPGRLSGSTLTAGPDLGVDPGPTLMWPRAQLRHRGVDEDPTGAVTRFALAGGAAAALLALALPRATGAGWHDIAAALSRPTAAQLALLGVLWLAGLCVHTPALTAALPGLSHRRALLLNLSGSFVSNLLPLGGAAGTVVNWRMARTWGFSSGAFGRWAVVTNLSDTLVKLALPGLVLCWFALGSSAPPRTIGTAAAVGAALLVVSVLAVALVARDDRPAPPRRWVGRPGRSAGPRHPHRPGGLRRARGRVPRAVGAARAGRLGSDARRQARVRRAAGAPALGEPAGGRRPGRTRRRRVGLRGGAGALHGRPDPGGDGRRRGGDGGRPRRARARSPPRPPRGCCSTAASSSGWRFRSVAWRCSGGGSATAGPLRRGCRRPAPVVVSARLRRRSAPGPCARSCSSCRYPSAALVRGLAAPPAQRYSAKKPATSSGCSVT